MALQNGELSKELLDSQAHIWNHIFSFINSMSLKCAIQLQIPDIIHRHGAPMLLSELVEALAINQERTPFVYRLMRILVHSGFFVKQSVSTPGGNDEEGGEGYLLTPWDYMFEAIPRADAVLLNWILHDWSDEECMKILKQCRKAIPSKENGGKLIIMDMVVKVYKGNNNELLETQYFFDMLMMMTLVTGRERSEKDGQSSSLMLALAITK
uniref:Putative O-methyltransferase COMT-type, S-adenosyl-L-methionine-dependent methyltransferase n=1 Tax=Helianthus annuus TaxID=4232 RepID=A0A251S309_HELAN